MKKTGIQKLFSEWAKNLESGKYKQGRGFLCEVTPSKNKRYCCLGVLLETLGIEKNVDKHRKNAYQYGIETTALPQEVCNSLNMPDQIGTLIDSYILYKGDRFYSLADFNDDSHSNYRFRIVASIINKYPGVISTSFKLPKKGEYKLCYGATLVVE